MEFFPAVRSLLREPGLAAVAVLTIALGVGANTAIFSVVNGVLLKPLGYPEPERLVALHEMVQLKARLSPPLPVSARHYTEWRQRARSFENISVIFSGNVNITGAGEPERVDALWVSANMFDTLGVQPALGRGFAAGEDEEGSDAAAVLSHSLWQRRFRGEPAIVGQPIILDGRRYTIVGVLPPNFRFPAAFKLGTQVVGERPEIFRPLSFSRQELSELMGMFNYGAIARLKRGVTQEQALAELNVIAGQLVKLAGEDTGLRAGLTPLRDAITGKSRRALLVLWGAVGSVLLIVCVNLANLMLARAERRSRETAIRAALGAGGRRLMGSSLAECLVLSFAGGTLGVAVAAVGLKALLGMAPADTPRLSEVSLDGTALLFALAITTATGLLFGLVPAWRAVRTDPQHALQSGGRTATGAAGTSRLRGTLVGAEVALGAMLLVTAALLMSSFMRLMRAEKGFNAPTVLATDILIPTANYRENEQRNRFHERLLAELEAQPGVVSAAISTALPLEGETWVDAVWAPGDAHPGFQRPQVNVRFISQNYLRTMGIPLIAGRMFTANDREKKVAVISERLARTLWPNQNPLGRSFERGMSQRFEVIGVAGDVRADADREPVPMWYRPYWEWAPRRVMLVARASGDPRSIAGAIRAALRRVDPNVPLREFRTMQQVLDDSVAQRRFQMRLAAVFGVTALLLAALGIYGVVSYSVARRTGEMGIRMALGAQSSDVYAVVLRQGLTPVAVGLGVGLAGALAGGRVLASLLYEVSPRDPFAIGAVAALLGAAALAACLLPARRATRVDPLVALRYE